MPTPPQEPSKTETPTPRTDTLFLSLEGQDCDAEIQEAFIELARALERENQELRQANETLNLLRKSSHEPTNTELMLLHSTVENLHKENQELREESANRFELIKDACGDEETIKKLARPILGDFVVDGDNYGVPTSVDICESLISRLSSLTAVGENLIEALVIAHCFSDIQKNKIGVKEMADWRKLNPKP